MPAQDPGASFSPLTSLLLLPKGRFLVTDRLLAPAELDSSPHKKIQCLIGLPWLYGPLLNGMFSRIPQLGAQAGTGDPQYPQGGLPTGHGLDLNFQLKTANPHSIQCQERAFMSPWFF